MSYRKLLSRSIDWRLKELNAGGEALISDAFKRRLRGWKDLKLEIKLIKRTKSGLNL